MQKYNFQRITADDWGLSPAVNEGILELARCGIVRRVSILVEARFPNYLLKELKEIKGLELGLHFDLTLAERIDSQNSFSLQRLRKELASLFNRKQKLLALKTEARRQVEKARTLGVNLAYIDGHHHVQILPLVSEAVASVAATEGIATVRLPYDNALWLTKKMPLNLFSIMARKRFKKHGIKSDACIYPQQKDLRNIETLKKRILGAENKEIIFHPAIADDLKATGSSDSYTIQRVHEFHILKQLFS